MNHFIRIPTRDESKWKYININHIALIESLEVKYGSVARICLSTGYVIETAFTVTEVMEVIEQCQKN